MAGSEALRDGLGWLLLVGGVGAFGLCVAGLWIRCTRYRLGRHEFEILISRWVVRRILLSNIEDVVIGTRFPCEFWPSRHVLRRGCVTIRRKRGWFKNLTVTPHDPEQLRINLCYALGRKP